MKDAEITYKTKMALSTMARGGLASGLFEDTPEEDAEMMMEMMMGIVPKSRAPVVVAAIKEWRADHKWLENVPDTVRM